MQTSRLYSNPYFHYVGKPSCRCMELGRLNAVELVAQSIYHDFPAAVDRRLWVGDCCPFSGNCVGHPGASHGKKVSMDVNYYTHMDSNQTHYPGRVGRVELWSDPGKEMMPGVFDGHRNFLFFTRLSQAIPGTVFWMNDVLFKAMGKDAERLRVQRDTGTTYNHHLHCHVELGDVDPDFRIRDLFLTSSNEV